MKLSVSNIVWGKENFGDYLKILKNEGCDGVELAPSLIWDEPISSNKNERQELKKKISDSGLEFIGFHSLLFSKPELQLFKNEQSRKKTIEYKIQKEHKTMIKENDIKKDLDSILDKINNEGFDSLSENEQERLYKGSQSLSRNKKRD